MDIESFEIIVKVAERGLRMILMCIVVRSTSVTFYIHSHSSDRGRRIRESTLYIKLLGTRHSCTYIM